ncbi:hypothetical protein [Paenibacillus sp. GbtcB18]|nr:hypothetical protein [Paenibacillus sp. GbtcB18]
MLVPTTAVETPRTDLVERSAFAISREAAPSILSYVRVKKNSFNPDG